MHFKNKDKERIFELKKKLKFTSQILNKIHSKLLAAGWSGVFKPNQDLSDIVEEYLK